MTTLTRRALFRRSGAALAAASAVGGGLGGLAQRAWAAPALSRARRAKYAALVDALAEVNPMI
ncbi:MAG TPA: hypothetical protein VJT75_03205, partial [Thermoleophilaceae bacterium]|nr:hypothetical protein [Thermoleophilaceae bacterium]